MEGKLRHKRETEAHRVPPSSVPFGVPVSLTGAGQAGRARLLRLLLRGAPRCGFGAFWGFLGFCFWGCRWVRGGLGGYSLRVQGGQRLSQGSGTPGGHGGHPPSRSGTCGHSGDPASVYLKSANFGISPPKKKPMENGVWRGE